MTTEERALVAAAPKAQDEKTGSDIPSRFGLLDSAHNATDDVARWESGYTTYPDTPPASVSTWDPNCDNWVGGPADKSDPVDELEEWDILPLILEVSTRCIVGDSSNQKRMRARVEKWLELGTGFALESELWTGTKMESLGNPFLTDGNAVILGAGDVHSPSKGLSMLTQALSTSASGVRGTIHIPAYMAMALEEELEVEGDHLVTFGRGDLVIAGNGYPGTDPDGDAADDGTAWIYATGLVTYRLGDIEVHPDKDSHAYSRTTNLIDLRAERFAAIDFDKNRVFAVQVDVSGMTLIDGGGA